MEGVTWQEHLSGSGYGKVLAGGCNSVGSRDLHGQDEVLQPVSPRSFLTACICNVIYALTFGRRFDHTSEEFLRLIALLGENLKLAGTLLPYQAFPVLKYVFFGGIKGRRDRLNQDILELLGFVRKLIEEHSPEARQCDGEHLDYIGPLFVRPRFTSHIPFCFPLI